MSLLEKAPDKVLVWTSFLGSIASIAGLILTFYTVGEEKEVIKPFIYSYNFILLTYFIMVLYYSRRYYTTTREEAVERERLIALVHEEREKGVEFFSETVSKIHTFCHLYRDDFIEIQELEKLEKRSEANLKISSFLKESCNLIKDLFDDITDEKCSVAIKTIIDDKEGHVITIARDRRSVTNRKDNKKFSIDKNTAFREIHEYAKDCYFHNNLKSLGDHYHNENQNWLQYYNCVLVVPIRYKKENEPLPRLAGYLAVDCKENIDVTKEKEVFKDEHKYILGIFADSLFKFITENGTLIRN